MEGVPVAELNQGYLWVPLLVVKNYHTKKPSSRKIILKYTPAFIAKYCAKLDFRLRHVSATSLSHLQGAILL